MQHACMRAVVKSPAIGRSECPILQIRSLTSAPYAACKLESKSFKKLQRATDVQSSVQAGLGECPVSGSGLGLLADTGKAMLQFSSFLAQVQPAIVLLENPHFHFHSIVARTWIAAYSLGDFAFMQCACNRPANTPVHPQTSGPLYPL